MGLYDVKNAEEQAYWDADHLPSPPLPVQMFQCETCPHKGHTVIDPKKVMKLCDDAQGFQPCHCDKDAKACCRGYYNKAKNKSWMKEKFLKGGVIAIDENDYFGIEYTVNLQNESNRHLFKDIG